MLTVTGNEDETVKAQSRHLDVEHVNVVVVRTPIWRVRVLVLGCHRGGHSPQRRDAIPKSLEKRHIQHPARSLGVQTYLHVLDVIDPHLCTGAVRVGLDSAWTNPIDLVIVELATTGKYKHITIEERKGTDSPCTPS